MNVRNAQNKAVSLARVSSKSQEDGYSLDAQQKLLDKYCTDNKLRVIYKFRISETASKNEQRTVFKEMLSYIKRNSITHLVVEKTDRLTRNFHDAVIVDDWLDANQQRMLHMVKEGLVIHKNSRSDSKLMWNIYISFAKKYSDNLREEAMKGWSEKLAQGWMPAPPPYGYKTVVENGKKIHVIDEDCAFLVERAFRLYLEQDQSINTVTEEVAKNGLVTRKGRPLSRNGVHKMLHNPFYIGVIAFNGKEYPGAHEPLLSRDLFFNVQQKLGDGYNGRRTKHDPLFKGMLSCDACGASITWQLQKGRYYGACQRRNDACKGRQLQREDRLAGQLLLRIDELDEYEIGNKRLRKLMQTLSTQRNPYLDQHRTKIVKHIKQRVRRLERIEDNLYEDKLAGVIDEQKYIQKLDALQSELATLQSRLANLEATELRQSDIIEPKSIRELYLQESKTGKRVIINELFTPHIQNGGVFFNLKTQK